MKFGIFGDIDGNLEALEAVLEDMQLQGIAQTVCTGDIVGTCANPRECLEIVRATGASTVRGDHDERAAQGAELNHLTREQRDFLAALPLQRLVDSFAVVHSSLDPSAHWGYVLSTLDAEKSLQHQETNVCFFGHTRVPHVFIHDTKVHQFSYKKLDVLPGKKYFVNVGSVGQPRDGDWRAAYAIYDSEAKTIELRRLPYDLDKAQAKVRNSGLP